MTLLFSPDAKPLRNNKTSSVTPNAAIIDAGTNNRIDASAKYASRTANEADPHDESPQSPPLG
ncbi:MAG TPA: hypothetical protein VF572_06335 [Candidatus Saccharimonadales bacterium]